MFNMTWTCSKNGLGLEPSLSCILNFFLFFMNREIIDGIVVFDENNNPVGKSKKAAVKGITQVVISRVTMAAPGMSELLEKFIS